jgi:hypothetical protein
LIKMGLLLALQATGAPAHAAAPAVTLDFKLDEAIVRRFDRNKDGALDLGEFQNAMEGQLRKAISATAGLKPPKPGELAGFRAGLTVPFRTFDQNANGSITLTEMRTAVSKHGKGRY